MTAHAPPRIVVETLRLKGIEVGDFLGKGAYSTVWSVTDRTRGALFAAKVISTAMLRLRKIPTERLLREIEIMQRLRHPRIVALDQVIACGEDMLVLLMELVPGKELFEHVLAVGQMPEAVARVVIEQLLDAVAYMHSSNVVHRDIKPENIMIDTVAGQVKLIDFGLGKVVSSFVSPTSFVGTPEYFAPEVNPAMRANPETGYTTAVDMWSIGIVLFVMLAGHFPQRDPSVDSGAPLLKTEKLAKISPQCRALLAALLEPVPQKRINAAAAQAHPWFTAARARSSPAAPPAACAPPTPLGIADRSASFATSTPTPTTSGSSATRTTATVTSCTEEELAKMTADMSQMQMVRGSMMAGNPSPEQVRACCQSRKRWERKKEEMRSMVALQQTIAGRFHESYEMALGVPAVAMSIRMSAVHCREHFGNTTKLLGDMKRHADNVIDMSDDVRVALEEGEPGLAVHFFQATATIIDTIKKRVDDVVARNGLIMNSLNEAIGLARLGGTMSDMMDAQSSLPIANGSVTGDAKGGAKGGSSAVGSDARGGGGGGTSSVMKLKSSSSDSDGEEGGAKGGGKEKKRISFPGTPKTLDATNVATAARPMLTASMQKMRRAVEEAVQGGSELSDEQMLELCFPMLQIGSALGSSVGGSASAGSPRSAVESAASASAAASAAGGGAEPQAGQLSQREVHNNLLEAANKLQEVDQILQEAQMFWALMQSSMETLLARNEYVAGMLHFTRNAKMRQRYVERMDAYLTQWKATGAMCAHYLELSSQTHGHLRGFAFLNAPYGVNEIRRGGLAEGGAGTTAAMTITDLRIGVGGRGESAAAPHVFANLESMDTM